MPTTFDAAFIAIKKLVDVYRAGQAHYTSSKYQETEARTDFIDKFFKVLGWDVDHSEQKNPYQQEVKVERGMVIGKAQRRADYAFHVAPNFRDPRFFVEAKKPHGTIESSDNYFQTIRYGWNCQTPLAILTDFQHFHILDCRYKPNIESALQRGIEKFAFEDYADAEKFARIYYLFSHESVSAGSLEKYAAVLKKPRGKKGPGTLFPTGGFQTLDDAFLADLDDYRTTLARAFKNGNPELDSEALTEVTQRTLDRLVFMRFLEDKLIEPERLVERFGDTGTAWDDFVAVSRRLDGIYNGIVFKPHQILDADTFCVDDTAFSGICEKLSDQNSPYDFDSIPIHILGAIYERFLGKVIVATDKRVKVEEKPEVRKAGGVYYTPEYIVRYIVENTVGKLIAGKTPKQIAELRFADIACGSGSFLLGVYDTLLEYHGKYYNDNPGKAGKGDVVKRDGRLYLSLRKKRDILVNNIYGVDIDAQAVEVAQLSLYLKLLKEETTASAHEHQLEFHETLLPTLTKNIVCGNSLVGMDILEGQLFEAKEERKLNPMDFALKFPDIMKAGGFDVVIGNPPYVRQESLGDLFKNYVSNRYATYNNAADLYVYFYERANAILKAGGWFGFISSNKFMKSRYGENLRQYISTRTRILKISKRSVPHQSSRK